MITKPEPYLCTSKAQKMNSKILVLILFCLLLPSRYIFSKTLPVGSGKTYSTPTQAAAVAQPCDTILIFPGTYQGAYFITNLSGRSYARIVIMGTNKSQVIFNSGTEGLHFSDINYIKIQDLTFTGQTGNSMNIDDNGSIQTPSKHIIVTRCDFFNMGAQGNNDFLKLSGLDSFEISECSFKKAATGGSGIDMVGCHYGKVIHCDFDSMGSNSIQMKGGTQFIRIENNSFKNGGQRALNLGGSTGLSFFRPIDAKFEAADIQVYANVFTGSMAPIAYVGSERVDVANNTIYFPEKWVIRILQETVDVTRFVPCGNNIFRNNIIYFNNAVSTHVNIGSNTASNTFVFSNNLWYNSSNPTASEPVLPVTETSPIYGQDPQFTSSSNFTLKKGSVAISSGVFISGITNDMSGMSFKNPPSRGAYEYSGGVFVAPVTLFNPISVYPNPSAGTINIEVQKPSRVQIISSTGQKIIELNVTKIEKIDLPHKGIFYLILLQEGHKFTQKIIII